MDRKLIAGTVLSMVVGWTAVAAGQTFENTETISIPSSGSDGAADPYPSTIEVSGLTKPIETITVSLFGLEHTYPDDIDILLVGPAGHTVLLMSDCGRSFDISGVNLTFVDGAAALPDASVINSGTWRPTNYAGLPDDFSDPAPPPPYGSMLSDFAATDGNGTWSLYVWDAFSVEDGGSIAGGWSITVPQPGITYQGRLRQDGTPLDGTADLTFTLFDAAMDGAEIASAQAADVAVSEGLFTVELPFPSSAFDGSDRWLEIAARSPAGQGEFTTLSPRQQITAAPMAISAETAYTLSAADGDPANAVLVNNDGHVGIGTTAPDAPLHVDGGSDTEPNSGGFFQTGATSALNISIDNNEIMARNDGAVSTLFLNNDGGNVIISNAGSGNVGIARTPASNRLEVEGNASKTTAGDWLANSDARIKTDVTSIHGRDALEKLDRVRLVEFRYTDEYRAAHPSIEDRRYINVIAQEFAKVFPDHVKSSGETLPAGAGRSEASAAGRDELLQVDPYPLTIYSAAALQELHALVRQQVARIAALEARLNSLANADETAAGASTDHSTATTAAPMSVLAVGLAGGALLLLTLGRTARLPRGRRAIAVVLAAFVSTLLASMAVAGDEFEIDWFTIDGGGIMFATGGEFELGGTLGQHDAGPQTPMTGGDFELVGGFWTIDVADVCALPGDMNLDGLIDGDDVQLFVNCLFGVNGVNCLCADLDGGGLGASDVPLFVATLLGA